MKTNGDYPAFPNPDVNFSNPYGLTKREYFAAMAMQGLIASKPVSLLGNIDIAVPSEAAKYAVEYADALIKQLES